MCDKTKHPQQRVVLFQVCFCWSRAHKHPTDRVRGHRPSTIIETKRTRSLKTYSAPKQASHRRQDDADESGMHRGGRGDLRFARLMLGTAAPQIPPASSSCAATCPVGGSTGDNKTLPSSTPCSRPKASGTYSQCSGKDALTARLRQLVHTVASTVS